MKMSKPWSTLTRMSWCDALDTHLVIISDEQSSRLLDRRYQGMLPGIEETYLHMPPESSAPTDDPRSIGRLTVLPGRGVPSAHQADHAEGQDSTSSIAGQCCDHSDKNLAALLIRMSAAEPIVPDRIVHLPSGPARAEPATLGPHSWQKRLASLSRAKILIMALLAVAAVAGGSLVTTMHRPLPGSPAALTVQAQSPGAPVAATSRTAAPLVGEQSTPRPVDGGQPPARQAASDGAGPPSPQPVSSMEKPLAIAQIEPLPQIHPGNAKDPEKPALTAHTIPGVYFHVGSEADRERVRAMAPALRQKGMELVGIKIVSTGPSTPDIRYFRDNEREEALRVQKALLSIGFPVERMKHIGGMEARATPRLYEVWIMPGSGGERAAGASERDQ